MNITNDVRGTDENKPLTNNSIAPSPPKSAMVTNECIANGKQVKLNYSWILNKINCMSTLPRRLCFRMLDIGNQSVTCSNVSAKLNVCAWVGPGGIY